MIEISYSSRLALMDDAHPSELSGAASSSTRDGGNPVKAAQNCALRSKMMTISSSMPPQTIFFGSRRFLKMENGKPDFVGARIACYALNDFEYTQLCDQVASIMILFVTVRFGGCSRTTFQITHQSSLKRTGDNLLMGTSTNISKLVRQH